MGETRQFLVTLPRK